MLHSFFSISGFLIVMSYERTGSFVQYLWHRILRIMPAFWLTLAIGALIMGPIIHLAVGSGGLGDYFKTAPTPWRYLVKNFFLIVKQRTIGDTFSSLPMDTLNGSLWTLMHEFRLYLVVAVIGLVGYKRGLGKALFVLIALVFYVGLASVLTGKLTEGLESTMPLGTHFMLGGVLYLFRDKVPMHGLIAAGLLVAYVAAVQFGVGRWLEPFFVTYSIMYYGASAPRLMRNWDRRADYTYGFYIFGFSSQQLFVALGAQEWPYAVNLVATMALTIALAVFSFHVVERPALALKHIPMADYLARLLPVAWRPRSVARSEKAHASAHLSTPAVPEAVLEKGH